MAADAMSLNNVAVGILGFGPESPARTNGKACQGQKQTAYETNDNHCGGKEKRQHKADKPGGRGGQ